MIRRIRVLRVVSGLCRILPFFYLLLGTVSSVLAAAGEGAREEVTPIFSSDMLFRGINFIILVVVLYKFLSNPFRTFFANRREQILNSLDEARKSKEEAETRYSELSRKLANRDQEFEEIRRVASENAEKIQERILTEAREKARRLEEKVQESIRQEVENARELLKREAVDLALRLSEERLKKEITSKDHRQFLDQYLAGLKE